MTNEEYYLGRTVVILKGQIYKLKRQRYENVGVKLTVEEAILLNMVNEKTNQICKKLAQVTGKNKSVVMRIVDSLEAKGLLIRRQNSKDRRENILSLTTQGENVLALCRQTERHLTNDLLQGASKDDIEAFFRVSDIIQSNSEKLLKNSK